MEFHFYNRAVETLEREELRRLQDGKLRALMQELETNRFYREKLRRAGIDGEQVRRYEDLRALPYTTKNELVEEQRLHPPYGNLLTYHLSRYCYFHQTSGTTGSPLKWLDTEEDWETWLRCWGAVYRAAGVTEDDMVFGAFSFGPYVSHWTAMAGARHIGALALPGGGMSSEQRLRTILDSGCTVLVSTPTYALYLAEMAGQRGMDLRSSAVRITIHAGEPGASVPAVKRRIEEAWGATCYDHAGATEVGAWAFDCEAQSGAIHLNEAEFVFEVIDPQTGEPVAEGARGELVVTTLGRAGMPVLRYRTGDLVEMATEPCPCGRTLRHVKGGLLGRADDMLIVRGVNLYPSAVDHVIRSLPEIVEYEVEIRRVNGSDDLRIRIETVEEQHFERTRRLLLEAFQAQFNLRVQVEKAAPGSLPRYELKARRYRRISE
ncbi:MAG: AMP-binding protein [Acidobacteria bacterium]|nr:AMP-binding protein [Acidobacteriota bacterium]